jgi:SAM-dependent methyltransferase
MESESVIFSWSKEEAFDLLRSCDDDGIFDVLKTYVTQEARVLESGCGMARYVRYLTDRGWRCVGLEYRKETVNAVRDIWPDLDIVQGDVAAAPFPDDSFDAIISLGVVEHFPDGPNKPLSDMFRILKVGGVAIITVPCLNSVRRFKRKTGIVDLLSLPRALVAGTLKAEFRRPTRFNRTFRYAVYPPFGNFFEYRMTPREFANEVRAAGFEILDHRPHAQMDGIYHELNPLGLLISFRKWKFYPTRLGRWMHAKLKKRDFFCCHMQMIIATKNR